MHMSLTSWRYISCIFLGCRFGGFIKGIFRRFCRFNSPNISTQELYFVSSLEKSFVAYSCLFLIPSCTRNQLSAAFSYHVSKCHRSWSEPAPFPNALHPASKVNPSHVGIVTKSTRYTMIPCSVLRPIHHSHRTLPKVRTDINSTTLQHRKSPSRALQPAVDAISNQTFGGVYVIQKVRSEGKIHTQVYTLLKTSTSPI